MSFATEYKPDGFQVINQGINSGLAPNVLPNSQLAFAINTTFRGGYPRSRPGWKKISLKFFNENNALDTTLRDNFEDGLFQGAAAFERRNQLVCSIDGRLFAIDLSNNYVQDVSISGDLDRADLRRVWFVEAEDWIIRQDNQAAPLIYNGAGSRRSDLFGTGGQKEIPTGNVMAYSQGRIWVALPNRRAFIAGDLVYSPSGTLTSQRRDSVLKFTENEFWNGGGSFSIPTNSGRITGMASVAQIDTSQGQGPLQIFTDKASFSINAPISREAWQEVEFPIQSVSLINAGAISDWSVVNVNGDIWFRSHDGIRSFQVARREFGTWANAPRSKEMDRIIPLDDINRLEHISSATFDGRLLVTAAPYFDNDKGIVHRGLVALDFNPLSLLSGGAPPVWEGAWSGLKVLQLVSGVFDGVERCFAFTLASDDDIELWELTRDERWDDDGTNKKKIVWTLEGKAHNWSDGGWEIKQLETGDLFLDQMLGTVDWTIEYRPDSDVPWQSWSSGQFCATHETCLTDQQCSALDTLQPQYRARQALPKPSNDCDTVTEKPYRRAHEFQPRLTMEGSARVKKLRLWASMVAENIEGSCPSSSSCVSLSACPDDPFDYDIETANNL